MKKIIYTLNVGNYEPDICAITYPLMKAYAKKIGAGFEIIDRAYPLGVDDCKISGKFWLHDIAKANKDTWTIFLDSDALIHPDAIDYTACLDVIDEHGRPSVFSYGRDFAYERFLASDIDRYVDNELDKDTPQTAKTAFGMCTWFIAVTDKSYMLWEPPTEPAGVLDHIQPTVEERHIKTPASLLDDYQTTVNAAKHNLSITCAAQIHATAAGTPFANKQCFWHTHLLRPQQKAQQMRFMIDHVWRLKDTSLDRYDRLQADWEDFRKKVMRNEWK